MLVYLHIYLNFELSAPCHERVVKLSWLRLHFISEGRQDSMCAYVYFVILLTYNGCVCNMCLFYTQGLQKLVQVAAYKEEFARWCDAMVKSLHSNINGALLADVLCYSSY